jgi:hypothetical protein
MKRSTTDDILLRAAPPEIMYPDDVAVCLRLPGGSEEAERMLLAGQLGRAVRIAGRVAILRRELMLHLAGGAR